jgi:hypothetical protein
MEKLGRIERLDDLRTIWPTEHDHFTPWLAQPENLEVLGETLGVELEFEAMEKDVGSFSADILCKNTAEKDSWVVIENQLEKTDHRHLGQLLVYASGLRASTVVWISAEMTDEHRAAINWLNQIANKSARFFGLEIELWKIGTSPPAPRFNIICQPNDWEQTVSDAKVSLTDDTSTPSQALRIRYWTAFREYLRDKNSKLRSQKPSRDHWYSFGIGTSRAHLAALIITKDNRIGVELAITSDDAKAIFHALAKEREHIEGTIGESVEWREMAEKKSCRVVLFRPADPYDETTWSDQFAWLQSILEKFDSAFRPIFSTMFKSVPDE